MWFRTINSKWLLAVLVLTLVGTIATIANAQQAKPTDPSTFVYDNIGQEQTDGTLALCCQLDTVTGVVCNEHLVSEVLEHRVSEHPDHFVILDQ